MNGTGLRLCRRNHRRDATATGWGPRHTPPPADGADAKPPQMNIHSAHQKNTARALIQLYCIKPSKERFPSLSQSYGGKKCRFGHHPLMTTLYKGAVKWKENIFKCMDTQSGLFLSFFQCVCSTLDPLLLIFLQFNNAGNAKAALPGIRPSLWSALFRTMASKRPGPVSAPGRPLQGLPES